MAGELVRKTVCFYQTFILSESVVLLSRHFRQATKRYGQAQ
jgi:hypothetical protein